MALRPQRRHGGSHGKAGFDSVTIDLQHGLNDYQAALAMLQALAASDSTPMARVPWLEPGSS